ncbi:hypothetical protein [Paenibacillus kobensis]|uniref:hypothetical protein n=1 Tax=Paenibacillus kobensis TaxID=59841 RepID=UPI001FE84361|nr:hypothetical protein [Paenibacillus kobensis]
MNKQSKLSIVFMSILILAMFLSACSSKDKDAESTDNAGMAKEETAVALSHRTWKTIWQRSA